MLSLELTYSDKPYNNTCVQFWQGKGIDDIDCNSTRNMLCKIKAQPNGLISSSTIRPKTIPEKCHDGWHKINNHCYIVPNQTVLGYNAPAFCPNRYPGSHLAKIDSYDDFQNLQSLLKINYTNSFMKHLTLTLY